MVMPLALCSSLETDVALGAIPIATHPRWGQGRSSRRELRDGRWHEVSHASELSMRFRYWADADLQTRQQRLRQLFDDMTAECVHRFDTEVTKLLRPLLFECDTRLSFAQFCDKVDELKLPESRLVSRRVCSEPTEPSGGGGSGTGNSGNDGSADGVGSDSAVPGSEVADISELDMGLDRLWWGDEGFAAMHRNAAERDHLAGVPSSWWPGSDESGDSPADALECATAEVSYRPRSWQARWVAVCAEVGAARAGVGQMVGEETLQSEWWLLLRRQRDALLAVAWVMDGAEGWSLTDNGWDTDSDGDANSIDIDGKAAVEAFERRRRRMMGAVHELGGRDGG